MFLTSVLEMVKIGMWRLVIFQNFEELQEKRLFFHTLEEKSSISFDTLELYEYNRQEVNKGFKNSDAQGKYWNNK